MGRLREVFERAANEKLTSAQEIGEKLNGLMVQITQKSGVDGRLFGSVTNFDVAEALKAQGFNVEKAQVHLAADHPDLVGKVSREDILAQAEEI